MEARLQSEGATIRGIGRRSTKTEQDRDQPVAKLALSETRWTA
jgi:hypothetical protein